MHKNAKSCFHSRVLIVKKHLEEGVPVLELAQFYEVSDSLINRWIKRFKSTGTLGLRDRGDIHIQATRALLHPSIQIPESNGMDILTYRHLYAKSCLLGPANILPRTRTFRSKSGR